MRKALIGLLFLLMTINFGYSQEIEAENYSFEFLKAKKNKKLF
jgi:hypothetical protein